MFLTVDTSITIRAAADAVWDYACKPENWTASNPTEHVGLTFDSPDNLPHAGVTFTQREASRAYRCSFNLTFPRGGDAGAGWTSPYHFGINLGPLVLMCENERSGLLWRLMRACPYVVTGLRRAGFTNGWL